MFFLRSSDSTVCLRSSARRWGLDVELPPWTQTKQLSSQRLTKPAGRSSSRTTWEKRRAARAPAAAASPGSWSHLVPRGAPAPCAGGAGRHGSTGSPNRAEPSRLLSCDGELQLLCCVFDLTELRPWTVSLQQNRSGPFLFFSLAHSCDKLGVSSFGSGAAIRYAAFTPSALTLSLSSSVPSSNRSSYNVIIVIKNNLNHWQHCLVCSRIPRALVFL